jgi:ABC-type glycerol-3-phosphate transport system substrate-binding protein
VEMWRILKDWRQYFTKDLTSTDFVREFVTQRGAMMWSTSIFVNMLTRDPDIAFDWDVFYVPPIPREYSRFAAGREQAVIGGSGMQYEVTNSAIRDTRNIETSERLQRTIAFLQFLTLPENTDVVVNEMVALLPNIKGVDPHPHLQPFDDFLQQHYAMTKWVYTFDLRFKEIMERMFQLYLDDGIDEEEFLIWMERNLDLATETITRRKGLDFSELERVWESRAEMRRAAAEIPDAAR